MLWCFVIGCTARYHIFMKLNANTKEKSFFEQKFKKTVEQWINVSFRVFQLNVSEKRVVFFTGRCAGSKPTIEKLKTPIKSMQIKYMCIRHRRILTKPFKMSILLLLFGYYLSLTIGTYFQTYENKKQCVRCRTSQHISQTTFSYSAY